MQGREMDNNTGIEIRPKKDLYKGPGFKFIPTFKFAKESEKV